MSPAITTAPAKKSYYRLLQASYQRAEQILHDITLHPQRYHPAKKQEMMAYLNQLQREMREFHIND